MSKRGVTEFLILAKQSGEFDRTPLSFLDRVDSMEQIILGGNESKSVSIIHVWLEDSLMSFMLCRWTGFCRLCYQSVSRSTVCMNGNRRSIVCVAALNCLSWTKWKFRIAWELPIDIRKNSKSSLFCAVDLYNHSCSFTWNSLSFDAATCTFLKRVDDFNPSLYFYCSVLW